MLMTSMMCGTIAEGGMAKAALSGTNMQGARSRGHQGGFSMIELLVAVLVVGIGVLGITGLQVVSLQHSRAALLQGDAVHLSYDILDRIRSNRDVDYAIGLEDDPPEAEICTSDPCSPEELRDFDLAVWKCSLGGFNDDDVCEALRDEGVLPPLTDHRGLPDGDGRVVIDGDTVTVRVRWTDANNTARSIDVETQI